MNSRIASSLTQHVQVQNVLRRSFSTRTLRFPGARCACSLQRIADIKKAGRYVHRRNRNRVTEMKAIDLRVKRPCVIDALAESTMLKVTQSKMGS